MRWYAVVFALFSQVALYASRALARPVLKDEPPAPPEGSCLAGEAASPSCRLGTSAHDFGGDRRPSSSPTTPDVIKTVADLEEGIEDGTDIVGRNPIDVIDQELLELEEQVRISKEQISLLEEMKAAIADPSISVPKAHAEALLRATPDVSHIAFDRDNLPWSSADDYLISKWLIKEPDPVAFLKLLPLRNPRTLSPTASVQTTLPSALVVAVQKKRLGEVVLADG